MADIMGAALGAVVGIIGIVIFVSVYHAIPTGNFSSAGVQILNLVDLVLAAVIIIGILYFGFARK